MPLLRRLAARASGRLPDRVLERALRLRSLGSSAAPTIGAPRAQRVLVLAPHPDDETLGAGGTLALLTAGAADVSVAVVSDGAAATVDLPRDELVHRRRSETVTACATLGIDGPSFHELPDGGLTARLPEVTAIVRTLLDDLEPELVLLPWFGDAHPDHRAVNQALAACGPRPGLAVWGTEIWTPAPINRLVDISAVVGRKHDAIAAHGTAGRAFDLEAVLGLNRYRSLHGLRGRGHAEGFVALPFDTFAATVTAVVDDPDGPA